MSSEYEQTWNDWENARSAARHSGRGEPVICIMGQHTYEQFLGALQIRVSGLVQNQSSRSRVGPITIEGIAIYPSCEDSAGYKFGYVDEEVIL